jgi:hypothetical protein
MLPLKINIPDLLPPDMPSEVLSEPQQRLPNYDMMKKHLTTIWAVDTAQGHEIELIHSDLPVASDDEAAAAEQKIAGIVLQPDGALVCSFASGATALIDPDMVTISQYTRPMEQRGKPFIPNTATEEGCATIAATFVDPAYIARPEEFKVVKMSLAELAAIPGATGTLSSLAYGMR